jgi:hypothetical protein
MAKRIVTLSIVAITVSLAAGALAGDTDRLAGCIAAADRAKAAAESREAEASPERTVALDARDQAPAKSTEQVNTTTSNVYSDGQLIPEQASARAFQNCFEAE